MTTHLRYLCLLIWFPTWIYHRELWLYQIVKAHLQPMDLHHFHSPIGRYNSMGGLLQPNHPFATLTHDLLIKIPYPKPSIVPLRFNMLFTLIDANKRKSKYWKLNSTCLQWIFWELICGIISIICHPPLHKTNQTYHSQWCSILLKFSFWLFSCNTKWHIIEKLQITMAI